MAELQALRELRTLLVEIDKTRDDARALSGEVEASYSTDQSESLDASAPPEPDLYKIGLGAKLRRGGYPSQFVFDARASVQHRGNASQEDVATYSLSFEHSANTWVRVRPFVERFTDNYLSIDQRWEAGGEVFFSTERGLRSGVSSQSAFRRYCSTYSDWRSCWRGGLGPAVHTTLLEAVSPTAPEDLATIMREVRERQDPLVVARTNAVLALRRQHAKWALGFGVGLFGELETATIRAQARASSDGPEEEKIFTFTDRSWRLLGHPYALMRLTEHLSLEIDARVKPMAKFWDKAAIYKLARTQVGEAQRAANPERRVDIRADARVRVEYALTPDQTSGGEKVTVALVYAIAFDNVPPSVPAEQFPSLSIDRVAAASQHSRLDFRIGIQWGS